MCIIIFKPEGKTIPESLIREQWTANPHGAGFAVKLENEKYPIFFKKGFMKLEHLLNDPDFSQFNSEEFELVLHLRKATHGRVSPLLCHPFPVISLNRLMGRSLAVMFHNGTFGVRIPTSHKNTKSDTLFVAEFARRIGLKNFKHMLRYDILNRSGSRVLLWTADGKLFKGQWHSYRGLKLSKPIGNYRSRYFSRCGSYNYPSFNFWEEDTEPDYHIYFNERGEKTIAMGHSGTRLRVLRKTTEGILLEDGSLWDAPPELEEVIEAGDIVEF